ncbi:MAG: PHP domain-containing protein [Clostridiales bacterium]|nr:PHP domain-containing protein [Clostridiales bacterium]
MRADLHLHSTYSDGVYSPDEVCRLAKANGVELLSITDHDTMAGHSVKIEAAKKYGLKYLVGWEISAYADLEKVHVLGYGCVLDERYEAFLSARKAASLARAEESVKKFRAIGIPVSMEDINRQRSDLTAPIHTMHISRAVSKYLDIPPGEVYAQYLNVGKPANSNLGRPSPKEAIECIHELGGIAVLAHPGRITMTFLERENLIEELISYGLDGIESYYTTHTEEETAYFLALAKKRGLLTTGGSDTHVQDTRTVIGTPAFYAGEELLKRVPIFD